MRSLAARELFGLVAGLLVDGPGLRRRQRWPRERLRTWQLARLQRIVRHAYDNVPLYRDKYDRAGVSPRDLRTLDDLRRFPTVTKAEIIAQFPERTLARGFELADVIVSRSSGSSGQVLDIAYDSRSMTTFILAGLRLFRMGFNYRPWHRQLYVYTSPYPLSSLAGLYPMHFVSTLAPDSEILGAIQRVRPHLLVCYPSHLRHLLSEARSRGIRLPAPRLVSVNSEMSSQAERDEIARELGCPVLDEYSSEELTRIAAQCSHGVYHVFEDINYLETVDESGQPVTGQGLIVGTNLHNRAMPMIRYEQCDLGRVSEAACPCGRTFRQLSDLQGRANDSFVLPSGRTITSGFLLDATYDAILSFRTAILDFCLVQLESDSIVLEIVPGKGWTTEIERELQRRFMSHFGAGVSFRVVVVAECRKTKSGKRNPIMNLCRRDARAAASQTGAAAESA